MAKKPDPIKKTDTKTTAPTKPSTQTAGTTKPSTQSTGTAKPPMNDPKKKV